MVGQGDTIRLEQKAHAAPSFVWEALMRPGLWLAEAAMLEDEIGGHFHEPWTDSEGQHDTRGVVTALDPPHRLVMTWKDDDWALETEVCFEIEGDPAFSLISLTHSGWDAEPAVSELRAKHARVWPAHLRQLAACAEKIAAR